MTMNQIAYKVMGNELCVTMAGEAAQMELNAMEPVMAQCCFESVDLLINGFDTLRTRCVDGIVANEDRCREEVHHSIGVVTALNPVIGYKNSTKIAKEALETGVSVYHQVEVQQAVLSIEQLLLMAELETTPANVGAVQETSAISWVQIVLLVYWAGILFLACRNIYSLICLFRLVHSGKHEKLEKGVTLVVHNQEIVPFSWMKYIVISRKDLEENGREILIHEMAHQRAGSRA